MPSMKSTLAVAVLAGLANAQAAPPADFARAARPESDSSANPIKESAHFSVYGTNVQQADSAINLLESAFDCFIGTMGWRSTGLSFFDNQVSKGSFKTNIMQVPDLSGGAAGVMHSDAQGLGWLEVVGKYLPVAGVVVHEYGHVMTYHERGWVDQGNTGMWWEPVANFIADYAMTSEVCAPSRAKFGIATSTDTNADFEKLVSNSHQTIVDGTPETGNYYEAWPFFTYLTNNPDQFPTLGRDTLREMFRQFKKGSKETPLHALRTVAGPDLSVPTIIASYWARVAFADLWHKPMAIRFNQVQKSLNYANLDSTGTGTYRVKAARQPKYMGASMIPLKGGNGPVSVKVTSTGQFETRVAIRAPNYGKVRYVYAPNGEATFNVGQGDEVMLVVANTPSELLIYDAKAESVASGPVSQGLDFSVQVTGATA